MLIVNKGYANLHLEIGDNHDFCHHFIANKK